MENDKSEKIDKRQYETPELTKYGKFTELTLGAGSYSDFGTFGGEPNPIEPP